MLAYLARVIIVCKAIDDWTSGIFCQLKNVFMSKKPCHDHIIVPAVHQDLVCPQDTNLVAQQLSVL